MSIIASLVGVLNGATSPLVTKYVAAVVILLVGFIIARMFSILARTILNSVKLNEFFENTIGFKFSIEEILIAGFTYFIYFITIIMALNQLSLTTRIIDIVAIAIIVIVVISMVIAIKDFFPNIIAGFYMLHFWHIKVGDKIEFDNTLGKIIEMTLLDTMLETPEKDFLIVPNTTMYKTVVKVKKR